jgi:amino acid adenylation domain-containing protein
MIVNTVALRADLAGDPTVSELLDRVRRTTFDAYAHREIPFGEVVEAVQPERRLSHLPVYQTAFSFHDAPYPPFELPGARMHVTEALSNESAKFDLQVISIPRGSQQAGADDEVTMLWEYATDLFDEATIVRMEAHYRSILQAMLADDSLRVSALPLVTDDERRTLVEAWSGRETPYPRATADALFARQAAAAPGAVALRWDDGWMSYGELDAGANRLAHHLRALGVRAGTRVGVCLERSPGMITATLAVLKAGGAYVMLDPAYPAERLAWMLEDSGAGVLVTEAALAERVPAHGRPAVLLDRDADAIAAWPAVAAEVETGPESPAYVMYTSGSTGRPKGIEVPHRAIVRLVRETDFIDIRPDDVFLQLAPASFDAATLEIWGPLLNGARLALPPAGPTSVDDIARAVAAHGVTILWLTAGLFHLVVDERIQALRGVRQLLAGGDVLSPAHVRRVLAELPGTVVINGYGPTENTTFTACHRMDALAEDVASVPIGRPITNTRVYVLDEWMQPVPAGVPGELWTGGAGLALGYVNRPALTAEKFAPSPFGGGERLYRTGDRVRWREESALVRECVSAEVDPAPANSRTDALTHSRTAVLEFLGRLDTQVKVRGFRIEPGEVEAALRAHPSVTGALVIVRHDPDHPKRLVAYVTGEGVDAAALKDHLRDRLPEHMLPAAVVALDRFPLTPNGKVDTAALPAPEPRATAGTDPGGAPRTETERALVEILAGVLRLGTVGIHDNFFELGGDSVLSMQLVARAQEAGLRVTTRQVFLHQTVAGMAAAAVPVEAPAYASQPESGAGLDAGELDELLYALGQEGA